MSGISEQNEQPHLASGPESPPAAPPAELSQGHAWLRDVIVAVAVSMFIILFLYQPVRVEGTSMMPGLVNNDRLFVNKFAYRLGDIHRNDIVTFLFPKDTTKSYIKRVIGLPGDHVRIDHGQVYVNGIALKEPYVPLRYQDDRSFPDVVVPAGQYYVLGDHRSVASDSRDFGTVERKLIYGRAAFVYWPMDQAGVIH
jgi:signal peptidase I